MKEHEAPNGTRVKVPTPNGPGLFKIAVKVANRWVYANNARDAGDDVARLGYDADLPVEPSEGITSGEQRASGENGADDMPDTPSSTEQVIYEHCREVQIFLESQPDWRRGEFEVGGPRDIWAGFKCSRHTHHLIQSWHTTKFYLGKVRAQ